jgi:hypothetical protein
MRSPTDKRCNPAARRRNKQQDCTEVRQKTRQDQQNAGKNTDQPG